MLALIYHLPKYPRHFWNVMVKLNEVDVDVEILVFILTWPESMILTLTTRVYIHVRFKFKAFVGSEKRQN